MHRIVPIALAHHILALLCTHVGMLLQTVQTASWVRAWLLDGSRLMHDTNTESSAKLQGGASYFKAPGHVSLPTTQRQLCGGRWRRRL